LSFRRSEATEKSCTMKGCGSNCSNLHLGSSPRDAREDEGGGPNGELAVELLEQFEL
jgi:hypothetical protein